MQTYIPIWELFQWALKAREINESADKLYLIDRGEMNMLLVAHYKDGDFIAHLGSIPYKSPICNPLAKNSSIGCIPIKTIIKLYTSDSGKYQKYLIFRPAGIFKDGLGCPNFNVTRKTQ
jgi:hypothetical protein